MEELQGELHGQVVLKEGRFSAENWADFRPRIGPNHGGICEQIEAQIMGDFVDKLRLKED